MANWKSKIDLVKDRQKLRAGELTLPDYVKLLVIELKKLPEYVAGDLGLIEIIDHFEELVEEPGTTEDDFDDVLEDLYDWGDEGHRLWLAPDWAG